MDINELKALLSNSEHADTIINAFVEKDSELKSTKAKKPVKNEAEEALREVLGYDGTSDFRSYLQSIKDQTTKSVKTEVNNSALLEKLQDLENKWTTAETKARQLEEKSIKDRLSTKLNQKLDQEIYGAKFVSESWINAGKVKEVDGETVFQINNEYVSFDKGVEMIIAENSDMKKLNQKAGSGSVSTTHNKPKDFSDMSVTDIMKNIDTISKEMGITI